MFNLLPRVLIDSISIAKGMRFTESIITASSLYSRLVLMIGILLTCVSTVFAQSESNTELQELSFERCTVKVSAYEVDAECATLKRPENPNQSEGKHIDLSVVKFPSRSPEPSDDAFTLIQGGPGGSSIDFGVFFSRAFEDIRRNRDIIVMDQRGTGRSNKLMCEIPDDPSLQYDPELVKELTQECLETLSESADVRFYTTSTAVEDLEALRVASGYSQWNLYGVSYGTRVVQHYLKTYPERSRTAIIDGVVYPGLNLAGGEIARRWDDTFEILNRRCQADEACRSDDGDLRTVYLRVNERLSQTPVDVRLPHPRTGEMMSQTITEDSLFGAIRLMAYGTEQTALIPLLLREADKGNYQFMASRMVLLEEDLADAFATGMHNSVVCTEDAPFVTEAENAKDDGTLVGEVMADILQTSCSVWPEGYMHDGFLEPFQSEVPVLALSGETDPITPPKNGDIAASMLGNALHLTVPAHGHGVVAKGCMTKLASLFVDTADHSELPTDCIERERSMPLFSTRTGPTP